MTCAFALRGITASEKLLLIALANYADENMRCYPSHKRLAADTCLTDRTIRGLLAGLEARKFISRKERTRPDGSRSSDIVTLHFDGETDASDEGAEISGGTEMVSGGVRKPLPGGTEMVSALTTFEPVTEPRKEAEASFETPVPKNGSRLSDGWLPGWTYTPTDFGLSDEEHAGELAKFRDYWRGVPGGSGRKLDWDATWRNWMRRASNDLARRKPNVRTDNSAKFDRHQANLSRAVSGAQIAVRGRTVEPAGGF
jgi:hypothetical protein